MSFRDACPTCGAHANARCRDATGRSRGMHPARRVLRAGDPRHGTLAGYAQRCRCGACQAANTRYMNRYRARRL